MHNEHEIAARVICEASLDRVRRYPGSMPDWYEGRACAASMICPTPENIGAANEIRFLVGDYGRRHGHV